VHRISLSLALVGATGCFIQDAQDRAECDRALAIVCGCGSVDCNAASPPPIVATLRRCDPDEIYRGYAITVCIADAPNYCAILDGVSRGDQAVCGQTCTLETSCDLEQACHDFQYASCDAP